MNPIGATDPRERSRLTRRSSTSQVMRVWRMMVTAASPARVEGRWKRVIGGAEGGGVVYIAGWC